ncbi:hypothetical protein [Taibaiella koreensis]|uniref:hypothetical protein n=1 Tax=Taibaiella koreensis TaxID=1268548 RepID=UPI000E59DB05|nr:hypothetical protein [Taibaiella koreensis]
MNLFNNEELKYLPVNCALFPLIDDGDSKVQPSPKLIDSPYHQNDQMEIAGNFYKSVTRMIVLKHE